MFKRFYCFYCFSNLSLHRAKTKFTSNFNQLAEKITKSLELLLEYKFRRFFASLQQTQYWASQLLTNQTKSKKFSLCHCKLNFLISIFLKPDGLNLFVFLRLFYPTEYIDWNCIGLQSLWHNSMMSLYLLVVQQRDGEIVFRGVYMLQGLELWFPRGIHPRTGARSPIKQDPLTKSITPAIKGAKAA